jgi:hypothetical protein
MVVELSKAELADVDVLLETMRTWVVAPPIGLSVDIVTFVHVARWRRMPLPEPRSAYARALFRLADASRLLKNAC